MSDDSDFETCATANVTLFNTNSEAFDINAGKTWIYPINYPIREYQFNIIQKSLFNNTLVSLPTGLGKTFIASVVMYNFYRWYPSGKILFLAPTRPLVKQQMDACYNVTAIPQDVTAELTGSKERKSREEIWKNKRVFFITPQVLQNDLDTAEDLGESIRCIVFDEAHKTRGNHAYAEVMRKLIKLNCNFRVLALSATPGKDVNDMKAIIQNLLISHLEFRTEESPDVQPYVFQRTLEIVVVPLDDKMQEIKNAYLEILESYTRSLIKYKIIQGNCSTLTKGKIFMVLKEFQAKNSTTRHANYSEIVKNLNACVTLYHAYELLIRHGLRSFLSFFEEHLDKPLLRGNVSLRQIVENVSEFLGPQRMSEPLPDGTSTDVQDIKCGHPKFYRLEEILINHFTKCEEKTRVIVFFEYRESVKEAYTLLLRNKSLIKPRIFLGQGAGITQKHQLTVIKAFKDGECNTLLSTSIGEEGLDVGEVDLIICFDISSKSPIRMIQRMGRTGRKRKGHIIILVTQGKEQQTLQDCLHQKKYLSSDITSSHELKAALYTNCPRMIPKDIEPQCEKVYFTVKNASKTHKTLTIKSMFQAKYNPQLENIEETDSRPLIERLPQMQNLWNKSDPLNSISEQFKINYCKNIDVLRRLQPYTEIGHSMESHTLVSLLQFADCKRYNIPIDQSQQRKNLKQGDIRDIFKQSLSTNSNPKHSQDSNVSNCPSQKKMKDFISDEAYNEISHFLSIHNSVDNTNCAYDIFPRWLEIPKPLIDINLNLWMQPDLSLLYTLTKDNFNEFIHNQTKPKSETDTGDFDENFDSTFWSNISPSAIDRAYEKQTSHQENRFNPLSQDNEDYENIATEVLTFFKLSKLEEIFEVPKSETTIVMNIHQHNTNSVSLKNMPESPTLLKAERISQLKAKNAKKNLFDSSLRSNMTAKQLASQLNSTPQSICALKSFADIKEIFDFPVSGLASQKELENSSLCQKSNEIYNDIIKTETLIDSSMSKCFFEEKETSERLPNAMNEYDADDICDLSFFGLTQCSKKRRSDCQELDEIREANGLKKKTVCIKSPTYIPESSNGLKGRFKFHKTSPVKPMQQSNMLNISSVEESQMTVTQIIGHINRKILTDCQNGTNEISNSKDDTHFDDLLNKMI